jgi:uncharacterized BrkB/YihY/UPF0761 family membrane protein
MIKKEILIGFLIGIFANLAGIYLYIMAFSSNSLEVTLQKAEQEDFLGSLIALGAILNFLPFFVFLKKNQVHRSRGVLIATFVAAIVIVIFKFT